MREANDYEVRRHWHYTMADMQYIHSKDMIDNLHILLKKYPSDPEVQIWLAGVYHGYAGETQYKDKQLTDKAIAQYKKVMNISNPDNQFYRSAQFYIEQILTMKKWYEEHPKK